MRIIHFSDFHLQGKQINRAETIVERMLDAIKPLHQQKPVDLIVFSGDLIDRAGEEFDAPKMDNGYNQFKTTVIDRIVSDLGLPANRFIFTPGNHDVNQKVETDPLYNHRGEKVDVILPEYGRPANITPPKK